MENPSDVMALEQATDYRELMMGGIAIFLAGESQAGNPIGSALEIKYHKFSKFSAGFGNKEMVK